MNVQPIAEQDLHAYADGRLEARRRAEIESWLDSHPQAREQVDAWRMQNRLLHQAFDAALDEPVPARLSDIARPRPRAWRLAAAFAWLALGGVVGFFARGMMPAPAVEASLPRQAAIAHAVFSPEVRHPVEVGADQEAHLVAWLSKRLGAELKPPRLKEQGFDLVGGRLLPGEGGPVAQFMYQDARGQRLTLYVRRGIADRRETAFRFSQEGTVSVFYWVDEGFGYALSGETARADLERVAAAVYRQLNP